MLLITYLILVVSFVLVPSLPFEDKIAVIHQEIII